MKWGFEYLDAWNSHDPERVVPFFARNCRYVDMPHSLVWHGHSELRDMIEATRRFLPDFKFLCNGGFRDGERYAVEWTLTGTVSGAGFERSGVSVGTFDPDQLVVEHKDYWNAGDLPSTGSTSTS